ncbi:MAG TPA: hypothetical protein VFW75_02970 [Acetobacteraceae bacterium]|nr:hypothetical protein [Acetobacteraceae bacterium]
MPVLLGGLAQHRQRLATLSSELMELWPNFSRLPERRHWPVVLRRRERRRLQSALL